MQIAYHRIAHYSRDDYGWLESRATAGETTTYDYDFTGNLTKVTLPDASRVAYQYDAANALIGVDDSLGNSSDYELDVMGNRVGETVFDPQQLLKKSLQRVYDGANHLQRELGAAGQITQYGYDGNKNLTTVTDPLSRVTTNTYDAKDRLATVKDPKLSATTAYNALSQITTFNAPASKASGTCVRRRLKNRCRS